MYILSYQIYHGKSNYKCNYASISVLYTACSKQEYTYEKRLHQNSHPVNEVGFIFGLNYLKLFKCLNDRSDEA